MTTPIPTPPERALSHGHLSTSLDDRSRAVLAVLDAATATCDDVRDALEVAGIHVPLSVCCAWLAERRRGWSW